MAAETSPGSQCPTTVSASVIKAQTGGLGIVVTPRPQGHGLLIAELVSGGEAEKTRLLQPGDWVLRVNDHDLADLPYEKCLQILQDLDPGVAVDLLVRVQDGFTTRIETTFDESGHARVSRITEPASPNVRKKVTDPQSGLQTIRMRTADHAVQTETNGNANDITVKSEPLNVAQRENGPTIRNNISPDRPITLTVSNHGSRKNSISSPSRRPVKLRNIITGQEVVESLALKATETVMCSPTKCMGSLMSGPPKRSGSASRPKEEVLCHARQFFNQYYTSIKRFNSQSHVRRWHEVLCEVEASGTFDLKETELVYGAKLAWRNAPRCIGRIQWSKLQVFDARYMTTAREMFDAICNHIKYATNKGNIRSAITIFPQRTDGLHDFRIWNGQLIQYAGYRNDDGTVLGDPVNVELTELCLKLGWTSKRTRWDIMPLLLSANGKDPQLFELPEELILRVPIIHPKYQWFPELDLQWYALPAVSSMLFDVAGVEFPACPFNGWYMVTEVGSRDLCDPHRFNILEEVAIKLGEDTRALSTLWKDRVVVEINHAVLYSFQKSNITIVDHHTASESFMKHWENEMRVRGGCPADWVWIVPPLSSSLTPVFHQEMLYYNLKPSYEYQEPPWKTHIWERDREKIINGPRTPKKYKFKEVARAVKFTSNLFGMALSRRIKATILFATETGRSEQYAKTLGQTFSHAFNVNVICMADYDIINLEHETLLLVVTSTFGNGDPPENGEGFARNLQAIKVTGDTTPDVEHMSSCMPFVRLNSVPLSDTTEDAEPTSPTVTLDAVIGPLSNVRFSVFALGSSAYPNFCSFGRYVDTMLGELGGERVVKMGTGDELCGQEHSFNLWAQELFQAACEVFCVGDDVKLSDVRATLHSDSTWAPDKFRLFQVKAATDICTEPRQHVGDNLNNSPFNRSYGRRSEVKTPQSAKLRYFSVRWRTSALIEKIQNTSGVVNLGLARGTNRKVVPCVLEKRTILHSEEESRQTILVEINTKSSPVLKYFPGDHVGIYPENRKELVESILERLKTTIPDPDTIFRLEIRKEVRTLEGLMQKWTPHERMPPCSIRTALTRYLDITTPPGQQFLRTLVPSASEEVDRRKIQLLATDSSRYEDWKSRRHPNLIEVLEDFSSLMPTPEFLLALLPTLQPRFYSISSAPAYVPGRMDLTVAVVVYQCQSAAIHYGVCSNYLATAAIGSEIACFVRSAPNFRLPDRNSQPVIMIGPGTGIAPFRSFWQQRYLNMQSSCETDFGKMTLFVGCRKPSIELYKNETQDMKGIGVLTDVHTAFSREIGKPKCYVQDILRKLSPIIYKEIVQERGHFYVCGDVSMAEDVNKTLKAILQEEGKMSTSNLDAYMKVFQEENRYHEDIFGLTLKTAEVTKKGREEARDRHSSSSS